MNERVYRPTRLRSSKARAGKPWKVFVSRYLVALPSPERLRELIEADRAALESSGTPAPADAEDGP